MIFDRILSKNFLFVIFISCIVSLCMKLPYVGFGVSSGILAGMALSCSLFLSFYVGFFTLLASALYGSFWKYLAVVIVCLCFGFIREKVANFAFINIIAIICCFLPIFIFHSLSISLYLANFLAYLLCCVFFYFVFIKYFQRKSTFLSPGGIVNRGRSKLSGQLSDLSHCFLEISKGYSELAKCNTSTSDVAFHITNKILCDFCPHCKNAVKCEKHSTKRNAELDFLARQALAKDKTTMLDFGEFFSSLCVMRVEILAEINSLCKLVQKDIIRNEEKAKAKKEVARTYYKIYEVLKRISVESSKQLQFDEEGEMLFSRELESREINFSDLCIYKKENGCVCVEIKAIEYAEEDILFVLVNTFGKNFFTLQKTLEDFGMCMFVLSSLPSIAIDYFAISKPKKAGEPNGDSYAVLKSASGNILCGICDGMGSGREAHTFSLQAIDFVRNLFHAGLDVRDVISSVNSYMESCEYGSYATLDLLELDLYQKKGYLYKIGSPDTYIKKDVLSQVSSKALPIGILKEIKLDIVSFPLEVGDKIVLSSDGVLDYMREEIKENISLTWDSAKIFAQKIMQGCDKKMKVYKPDDRTIIAIEFKGN